MKKICLRQGNNIKASSVSFEYKRQEKMIALVSIDANNIVKAKDGTYWCDTLHGYSFWNRYLSTFDSIRAATRVRPMDDADTTSVNRVDGERVEVMDFPMMQGMKGYALGFFKTKRAAQRSLDGVDCVIIRLPSVTGFAIYREAQKRCIPIALEVVADPNEAYKPNLFARWIFTRLLRNATRSANGVAYVTKEYLQRKYPCRATKALDSNVTNDDYFTADYSSIDLPKDFYGQPRVYSHKNKWIVIHTANGIHNYLKGHDTLIRAVKIVRDKGYNIEAYFIGDGRMKDNFVALADELGLGKKVHFLGLISDRAILRKHLADADLFVLPTHTEGLPRSVIEAMAMGLPCISTPVGGIPELLAQECLVPPNACEELALKIISFINCPSFMQSQSKRNFDKAQEYNCEELNAKRMHYYSCLVNKVRKRK